MNAMQPPQSIEEIKAGLETTEKGGVRQSIRNCLTVFQRDPLLSGAIAYNILTDRKDIIKPIGFHRESTALNDTDMKYLLLYLEETYGLTNEKKIDNAIGIVRYLKEHQRDFMPEDTKAGMIQAYLDRYTGSMVCSKQLYKEALNHAFDEPKQWEIREINEIMNQCIDRWRYFPNPRMFSEYGRQKGWERENPATDLCNPSEKAMDGFVEVTEQMELPF